MVQSYSHTVCRSCGATLPRAFLNLGDQPLANNLCSATEHSDETFPMRLARCDDCGLLQLDTIIEPSAMFAHYLYTPSQSRKTLAHFEDLAKVATFRFVTEAPLSRQQLVSFSTASAKRPVAVDVGSNDGALLDFLKKRGWSVCGVDPARNLAEAANAAGLPTVIGFFDDEAVTAVLGRVGAADLITANNVFAHTPNWATFAHSAALLLARDGRIAIEFPYGPIMLRDGTFDLIYFEHASYPSIGAVNRLFWRHGIGVIDVDVLPDTHGGSVRVWLARNGKPSEAAHRLMAEEEASCSVAACAGFVVRVERARQALADQVREARKRGRVVGFTAPAKCVTLLVAAGLGADDVECIVDDNPLKQGRQLPRLHIPIVSREQAALRAGDTVVIFAWNVAEDIVSRLPEGVSAIVPMPTVHVLSR